MGITTQESKLGSIPGMKQEEKLKAKPSLSGLAFVPVGLEVDREKRELCIRYPESASLAVSVFRLSCEFLRVYSPSAEVRGHTPAEYTLQTGKRDVQIDRIEPQGRYAISICFDDGHTTGIYTWEWLLQLCLNHDAMWADYIEELSQAGASRRPPLVILS